MLECAEGTVEVRIMKQDGRKIVIVGGGIAGLCAAVYAQKCGYQVEVLEMQFRRTQPRPSFRERAQ
jgi:2-polyprenyl-6-methoxyphenol hydroxylase-like FAD-dependent oxidoreductase